MAKKKYKSYLIVDGYNIINAWDGLKEISKEDLENLEIDFKENNLELYVVGEVIEKNEYNVYVR